MTVLAVCGIVGLFAGVLASLLGIGGGIILVPALTFLLVGLVPAEDAMKFSLATSMAVVFFTSIFATYQQWKAQNVQWLKVKDISFGVVCGAAIGAASATYVSDLVIKLIFIVFAMYVSTQMIFKFQPEVRIAYSKKSARMAGLLTGAMSSWIGIGGGNILVPWLLGTNEDMKKAAGITSPVGVVVSLFASVGYFVAFHLQEHKPVNQSIGFVYWPFALIIVAASFFGTLVGMRLSKVLDTALIKKIFAALLLITGLKLLHSMIPG